MTSSNPPYGFFECGDFLDLELPEREQLLSPWLLASSINAIYAKAGVGKSNLVLGMAMAMATGESFLGFNPTRALRVLYVDGEMAGQELQRRLKSLLNGRERPTGFYIYSMACAENSFRIPQLNTIEGQQALERLMDDAMPDVLILDNKSTLFSNHRENEAGSWDGCQSWLIKLRSSGMAVILLHHAGKNGLQRGTSGFEVVQDIIFNLSTPEGLDLPTEGSHFVMSYDKQRHLPAKDAQPLLVSLTMSDESATWTAQPYKSTRKANPKKEKARELERQGLTQREIAEELGASLGAVNGWLKE